MYNSIYIDLYCRMTMRSMWVGMYTELQYTLERVLVLLYSGNPCSRHQSQEYHSFIYPYIHPILSFIHLFVLSFIHLASMRPSFLAFMHSCIHAFILPSFLIFSSILILSFFLLFLPIFSLLFSFLLIFYIICYIKCSLLHFGWVLM